MVFTSKERESGTVSSLDPSLTTITSWIRGLVVRARRTLRMVLSSLNAATIAVIPTHFTSDKFRPGACNRQTITHQASGLGPRACTDMSVMKRILTLALVALSLIGCNTVGRALNIVNPTYTIRNVQPHVSVTLPLTASSIDFDFTVGIDNPNTVGLNLARLDFGVLVDGNRLIDSVS